MPGGITSGTFVHAVLAAAAVTVLAATSTAAALTEWTIYAHNEGQPGARNERPFWFEIAGLAGRNPTVQVDPGEDVRVLFVNRGDVNHTYIVGPPIDRRTGVVEPGGTATLMFRVPADATGATYYWCAFHDVLNMGGVFTFDGTTPTQRPPMLMDDDNLIPGPAAWTALMGVLVAACLARGRARR